MRRVSLPTILGLALLAAPASAQQVRTLDDAIARARVAHLDLKAADRRQAEAQARTDEARAAWLPRVDASEGWQRATAPVMVFGALLSQRRFSAADFDVARLNHPDPLDNFRAAVTVEQRLFDPATRTEVTAARVRGDMAALGRAELATRVVVDTIDTYGRALLFDALSRASAAAVASAEADLARARNRRDAGVATDADVLSLEVHLSAARVRVIETTAGGREARARLNYLMGEPLDAEFALQPLTAGLSPAAAAGEGRADALARRADVRLARAAVRLAGTQVAAARASFLPQVVARAGSEWNGRTAGDRTGAWFAGAEVRFNLFRGFGDRARLAASRAAADAAALEAAAVEARAQLEIRTVESRRAMAEARVEVARSALSAATESQRITRDRYENGMADVTALVASGSAVLDAEARVVSAEVDRIVEAARLQAALGAL